jgi:hypothetical protein
VATIVRYSVAAEQLVKTLEHIIKTQELHIKVLEDILTQKAQTDKTFNDYFLSTFSHRFTSNPIQ